jgi:hypothetical protein
VDSSRWPPSLVLAAAGALEHGLTQPPPAHSDVEAAVAHDYARIFAADLTAAEIDRMRSSTNMREHGLQLCRSGNVAQGAPAVSEARAIIQDANLGREAADVADSFLCAAESYVCYKSGRFDEARDFSLRAIARCRDLRDAYHYPVEGRRAHLVRNIARVEVEAGNYSDSAHLASSMLHLLDSQERCHWPYPDLEYATEPDELSDEARWALMDQTLQVLGLLASRAPAEILERIAADFPCTGTDDMAGPEPHAVRPRHFVDAMAAYACRADRRFLARCEQFFMPGPAYLPLAFQQLVDRFAEAALVREN